MNYTLKKRESLDITLPGGAVVTSRPVTRASFEACKADGRRRLAAFKEDAASARAVGFDPDYDFKDDDILDGLFMHFLIVAMGVRHITAWTGIADESGDAAAPVTPEGIEILLSDPVVSKLYYQNMMVGPALLDRLKKDSGGAAHGISSPAAAPDTAKDAAH